MKTGWLDSVYGQKVEHLPCPHPGQLVDQTKPAAGVMHTTEGGLEGSLAVFRQHYAPHFTVAGRRIIQHIPLGYMAAALVHQGDPPTNAWARAQIEVVGFSKQQPWLPDPATVTSLAKLLAALSVLGGIPLVRPFSEQLPPPPWATTSFKRRHSGAWGKLPGWYGHIEIPQNAHWDPGALKWKELLTRAIAQRDSGPVPIIKKLPKKKLAALKVYVLRRRHNGLVYAEPKDTPHAIDEPEVKQG